MKKKFFHRKAALPEGGLSFDLATHDISFTADLETLLVTANEAIPDPDGGTPKYISYRIPIGDGIQLRITSPNTLSISPPTALSTTYWREYMPLAGQFQALIFDKARQLFRAGGLGILDIADTDPQGFNYHELPLAGTMTLEGPPGETGSEVSLLGLDLIVSATESVSIQFEDPTLNITQADPVPVLVFRIYYATVV